MTVFMLLWDFLPLVLRGPSSHHLRVISSPFADCNHGLGDAWVVESGTDPQDCTQDKLELLSLEQTLKYFFSIAIKTASSRVAGAGLLCSCGGMKMQGEIPVCLCNSQFVFAVSDKFLPIYRLFLPVPMNCELPHGFWFMRTEAITSVADCWTWNFPGWS
jgi:hypothetical protein